MLLVSRNVQSYVFHLGVINGFSYLQHIRNIHTLYSLTSLSWHFFPSHNLVTIFLSLVFIERGMKERRQKANNYLQGILMKINDVIRREKVLRTVNTIFLLLLILLLLSVISFLIPALTSRRHYFVLTWRHTNECKVRERRQQHVKELQLSYPNLRDTCTQKKNKVSLTYTHKFSRVRNLFVQRFLKLN